MRILPLPCIGVAAFFLCVQGAFAWDCSEWRKELPSLVLRDVKIEARNEERACERVSWSYSIRFIRVDNILQKLINDTDVPFSFQAAECTVADLLDALTEHYNRAWEQDDKTGTLWVYPKDFDLGLLDTMTVEYDEAVRAIPMRSGVLDPNYEKKQFEHVYSRLGPSGIIRGQIPVYRFAEYAVDVPRGRHSLRDILNLACVASPSQAFVLEFRPPVPIPDLDIMTRQDITISTDSNRWPTSLSPAIRAYASRYLRVADGADVDTETLGQRLSSPDPAMRRSAQHYVEMTERILPSGYQPHEELPLIQNLWYALAYDRYDKMSHEGYAQVSSYILENVSDEFLLSCPDSHLVLLLGLERARIERDHTWLRVLQARAFKPEELAGLEHEVLYIARRYSVVWNALRQPESEYFIDTGGWAASFMDEEYPEPYDGPSWNRSHPAEHRVKKVSE